MLSRTAVRKGLSILTNPRYVRAVAQHRVAAATEHADAIRYCMANTLIDAGANKGQFSLAFRTLRPSGRIIAFEPLPQAASIFKELFRGDRNSQLIPVALASEKGSARFHVTDREDSSSLLRPGEGQAQAFGVRTDHTIEIAVDRLSDRVDLRRLTGPILLKVDVQGGELGVFEGCDSLTLIDFIYVELSFVELYHHQPLFHDVCDYLQRSGFAVAGIYNQITTAEFGPTQVDVLFKRNDSVPHE